MDPRDHLTPDSREPALPFVYSAGWLPLMGSGPSGAPIYLPGKELTTHCQSYSARALAGIVYSGALLNNFSGSWSPDHFHDTVQELVRWSNSARKSGCSSSIVAPKVGAATAKCALPPSTMCTPPNFLMTCIPRRRSNPNGLLFTTSTFVFKGLLLVTVKVMLPTPWLKRHFLLAVKIAVLFHTSGRHNILLTTDEEQPESTNVIRSIPLTFTFITGSTSSSLCGERVVPAFRPLPSFPGHLDATCPCCCHW